MNGWKVFQQDLRQAYNHLEGEGSTLARVLILVRTPGTHAVATYRLGHWLLGANILFKVLMLPLSHYR